MTAQEWLEEHRKRGMTPREENEAAAIIRAQQERVERLERAVYSACEQISLRKCSPDCPNNKKCAVITMVSQGDCADYMRKWLMEGK